MEIAGTTPLTATIAVMDAVAAEKKARGGFLLSFEVPRRTFRLLRQYARECGSQHDFDKEAVTVLGVDVVPEPDKRRKRR